jgi:hypothetical protein
MGEAVPHLPSPIVLKVPGEARFLRHIRVVARGIATTCGLTTEEGDDFRLIVGEVSAALIEVGHRSDLTLRFDMDGDVLAVEAETDTPTPVEPDLDRLKVNRPILGLLTRAHRLVRDGGVLRFRVSTVFECGPAT